VGMNPLVLIGLACIIAAIVGGGLKLMGIEIPLLTSVRRQVLLAGLGIALAGGVGIARLAGSAPPEDGAAVPFSPAPGTPECYASLFHGIAQDRVASLEEGSEGRGVIRQDQPKDEPVGLIFTENGLTIGAMTFSFFPSGGGVFKIDKVVDTRCREITQFSNATRPGSAKNTLQNSDALRIRFGGHSYTARFGSTGDIQVQLNREA
jgi:hypothetical protein